MTLWLAYAIIVVWHWNVGVIIMAKAREYVNNKKLFDELVVYKEKYANHKANPETHDLPPIPEYVGLAILKIAENVAKKKNFGGYSFREDMVGDGIENCLMYFRNFNPEKSKNPFAYFTQIIHFAFIRRIQNEAKQSYIKYKSIENSALYTNHASESKKHINLIVKMLNENTQGIITKFEERLLEKKKKEKEKKKSQKRIEIFTEE